MSGYVIAVLLMAWLVIVCWCGYQAIEKESRRWLIAAVVAFTIGLGFCIQQAIQEEESGPCLREATGYQYNAATKTTMPYTYCAQRGEWVK